MFLHKPELDTTAFNGTRPLRPENQNLLQGFSTWLHSKGLATRTVTDYPKDISRFLTFLESTGLENIRAVSMTHLEAFQSHLSQQIHRGKLCHITTVNSRLSQVKTFFRFLYKTGKVYHDPAASMELPKKGKSLPRGILEENEVIKLMEAVDLATPLGIRDRAILELLYSTGLRNTELRSLELRDIDLAGRTLYVKGKGGVEAYIPFGKAAKEAMEHYLYFARNKLVNQFKGARKLTASWRSNSNGVEYLFLSKNGHQINQANLWDMLQRVCKASGIEKCIGPHALRHTCATHLLRHGADIRHIQGLLRHKDLNTTTIYTRVAIEDLKQAQMKFHPREQAQLDFSMNG